MNHPSLAGRDRSGAISGWSTVVELALPPLAPSTLLTMPPMGSAGPSRRPRCGWSPGVEGAGGPSLVVVAAVAIAVFGLLGLVRWSQGAVPAPSSPPSTPAADSAAAVSVAGVGDQIVVVRPGDTLWSIAAAVTPEGDRRPVVAALIETNGGESLQIGQQIVIPSHLLD